MPGPPVEGSGLPGAFLTTIVDLLSMRLTSEYVCGLSAISVSVTAPSDVHVLHRRLEIKLQKIGITILIKSI